MNRKIDNEIVRAESVALDKQYFELEPTGLIIAGQPTFDEWAQAGEVLKYIEGSVHWWLGDWLNYGENAYSEMYSQVMDETGYSYQTLRDDKWVAKTFELSRRRDNLSWSHYREVAGLESDKAEELQHGEKTIVGERNVIE